MSGRFIDNYDVILLDMGNTFMFDVDRFGPDQDYHATYQQAGGRYLAADDLRAHITNVFNRMLTAARNPAHYDDFGDMYRFLTTMEGASKLPPAEVDHIVEVFARHEVGRVPQAHADALHELRRSHPLGLVSNIFSPRHVFEEELARAGVLDLFSVRVWSSDCRSIKPSPRLFQRALDAFDVAPSRVVYVGDNPLRDVAAAKAMGMGAVWIHNEQRPLKPGDVQPDLIISDLRQLPTIERQKAFCPSNGAGGSGAKSDTPLDERAPGMTLDFAPLITLSPGSIETMLRAAYQGWARFDDYASDWKRYDHEVFSSPDTVGAGGSVTFLNGRPVGFVSWDPRNQPAFVVIGHNCILPQFRGSGIGKRQLLHALAHLTGKGFETARVSTGRDAFFEPARRMYMACGFIERHPPDCGSEGMVTYERRL